MPIRVYRCLTCDAQFERLEYEYNNLLERGHFTERDGIKQYCDGKLEYIPATFSPKFVGKGFYETDYKKKE